MSAWDDRGAQGSIQNLLYDKEAQVVSENLELLGSLVCLIILPIDSASPKSLDSVLATRE